MTLGTDTIIALYNNVNQYNDSGHFWKARAYIIIPRLVRTWSSAALVSGFKKCSFGEHIHRFSENRSSNHGNKNAVSKNILCPFGAQKIDKIITKVDVL